MHPSLAVRPPILTITLGSVDTAGSGGESASGDATAELKDADDFDFEDFFEKLFQMVPDIIPYVIRTELYSSPGKLAVQSGGVGWVGYALLRSKTSRRHVLKMYHRLVEASETVLDEANDGLMV